MRRTVRLLGALMIAGGVLGLGWALLVWQWQDPVTALYAHVEQGRLASRLDDRLARYRPPAARDGESAGAVRKAIAADAAAYRRTLRRGEPVGRLTIPALGLRAVLVQGTDHESLKKGPGHYVGSGLPGEGRLVYVAGHRTTYLAPFSHIDELKPGDRIAVELPYGTFAYVVTGHRIVAADDVSVLRSRGREVLILQACHPRFFASHRYLVYARPASVRLPGGTTYALRAPERAGAA